MRKPHSFTIVKYHIRKKIEHHISPFEFVLVVFLFARIVIWLPVVNYSCVVNFLFIFNLSYLKNMIHYNYAMTHNFKAIVLSLVP